MPDKKITMTLVEQAPISNATYQTLLATFKSQNRQKATYKGTDYFVVYAANRTDPTKDSILLIHSATWHVVAIVWVNAKNGAFEVKMEARVAGRYAITSASKQPGLRAHLVEQARALVP